MVWLRNATKDDYSLDLDVNEDQHQFVASYKSILDYAFIEQDKEHTHAYIICEDDVAVGVIEYSDLYEIMAYNLSYIFIDRRYQNKSYGLKAVQLLLQKLGQEKKFDKVSVTLFKKMRWRESYMKRLDLYLMALFLKMNTIWK